MNAIERPTKEVTTPSGYKLKLLSYVTVEDRENMFLSITREGPDPDAENLTPQQKRANDSANFYNAKKAWLGIIIGSITAPDGTVVTGPDKIREFVRTGIPVSHADEINEAVDEVISPKKSEPTATPTSQPAEGKQAEAS